MTAHWLDRENMQRKHGALTCATISIQGSQTYKRIVQALGEVYVDYGITHKVTMTTIDNARNFAPTFLQFGQEDCLFPSTAISSVTQLDNAKLELLLEDEQNKKVEFLSVADMAASEEEVKPANHIQCAAHVWNLIISTDSAAALDDLVFREAFLSALKKAKPLWELQDQSVNFLNKERNHAIVVETDSMRKSLYGAFKCLIEISLENKKELHHVMTLNGFEVFSEEDINFITEFVAVMNPLATVIDLIQTERAAYLGWLLPLCATTVFKLRKQKMNQLQFCEALANALLNGINKRFDLYLNNEECLLASAFHPRFVTESLLLILVF